jgi:hypothetical protein
MRQRGFALLTFLPYIIGGIAVASLAGWLWWQWSGYKEGLREEGRAEVRVEWQAERAQLIAARDAMVMRWAKAIQEVERVYVEKVVERESRFSAIRTRAGRITVGGGIRLDPDAIGLLRDVASTANSETSAAPSGGAEAPAPVPETSGSVTAAEVTTTAQEWVTFAVDAAEAYKDAHDKWQACVAWSGKITQEVE